LGDKFHSEADEQRFTVASAPVKKISGGNPEEFFAG
jgi:hypothetical protein